MLTEINLTVVIDHHDAVNDDALASAVSTAIQGLELIPAVPGAARVETVEDIGLIRPHLPPVKHVGGGPKPRAFRPGPV